MAASLAARSAAGAVYSAALAGGLIKDNRCLAVRTAAVQRKGPVASLSDSPLPAATFADTARWTTKASHFSHGVACRSSSLEAVAEPASESTSQPSNGAAVNGATDNGSTVNGNGNGNGNGATAAESAPVLAAVIDEEVVGAANAESLGDLLATTDESDAEPSYYEPAFQLLAASKMIPHPAKVAKGGEDAVLVSDVGAGVIAVADGVGGWAEDGVDPALYSNEFVGHLNDLLEGAQDQSELEPRELLRRAHAATKSPGAATAIVAVFDGEQSRLNVASLGDAGVRVVRGGEVVHKSQAHEHFFDCPYQFGSESSDSADDAEVLSFPVQAGDTVVMASDGLFDNVFDKDIASIVKVFGGDSPASISRTATALAALAAKHGSDPEYMAPYTLEALAHAASWMTSAWSWHRW
eukprot:TRINITY_DN21778_c0_g1_i1.p1 TRINITY_DN21778_c0_g1~~TRINITY_DN21778_c0_g1_i1.p1  ORF type:complete len:410 (-),score=2.38 TRINITY_DN21778_c0_g1_i1:239-1468(-)